MNHCVYQITNQLNGKIYVGKRSCKCSIEEAIAKMIATKRANAIAKLIHKGV